ncbi:MAG TPA: type II secretion system protein GspG [Nitrospirota bacterium]|nr:type II secretion system protein GspG [Nitrospirota bacterium]
MIRNHRGFTLIEVIVVAGIIAVLAGILVPLIFKEIDEAKITRASADIRSITSALIVMKKDTGMWPNLVNGGGACSAGVTLLYGGGVLPAGLAAFGWDQSSLQPLENYLSSDANACYGAQWKGPYLAQVTPDPWGNQYLINATNFSANGPVWIISAGPNGAIETDVTSAVPLGDDIGLRLK